jgi:hypothetical protein
LLFCRAYLYLNFSIHELVPLLLDAGDAHLYLDYGMEWHLGDIGKVLIWFSNVSESFQYSAEQREKIEMPCYLHVWNLPQRPVGKIRVERSQYSL